MDDLYKYPRLYVDAPLQTGTTLPLDNAPAHYLISVMRRTSGDMLRVFNGVDGEFLARLDIQGKRAVNAILQTQTRPQPHNVRRVHLFFAPLKKDKLEILVNSAVQLGVSDLHPIVSERTEVRTIKNDKIHAHMIEAAEQSERLSLPVLHPIAKLEPTLNAWQSCPVFAGLERDDTTPVLNDTLVPAGDCAALIGPAGGWTEAERAFLKSIKNTVPISLGDNILRAETAATAILARLCI